MTHHHVFSCLRGDDASIMLGLCFSHQPKEVSQSVLQLVSQPHLFKRRKPMFLKTFRNNLMIIKCLELHDHQNAYNFMIIKMLTTSWSSKCLEPQWSSKCLQLHDHQMFRTSVIIKMLTTSWSSKCLELHDHQNAYNFMIIKMFRTSVIIVLFLHMEIFNEAA